jgi:hypothetical protein
MIKQTKCNLRKRKMFSHFATNEFLFVFSQQALQNWRTKLQILALVPRTPVRSMFCWKVQAMPHLIVRPCNKTITLDHRRGQSFLALVNTGMNNFLLEIYVFDLWRMQHKVPLRFHGNGGRCRYSDNIFSWRSEIPEGLSSNLPSASALLAELSLFSNHYYIYVPVCL